jgi:hypothetical protein
VESWELKAKLASPGLLQNRDQEVEVTSVNWESQDTAASASQVLVSYRWHGIMYDINSHTRLQHSYGSYLGQVLGCYDEVGSLASAYGGVVCVT